MEDKVIFGFDALFQRIAETPATDTAVCIDANVSALWRERLQPLYQNAPLEVVIPSGEIYKTPETCNEIWNAFYKRGFDRKGLAVIVGGGMTCDVGAYACANWMRGVRFVLVPTTLLAQADAAHGGKCGVNFIPHNHSSSKDFSKNNFPAKNLLGVFAEPLCIAIEDAFLDTLPPRELNAGFAEVFKHGIVADADFFRQLAQCLQNNSLNGSERPAIIRRALEIKRAIVSKDPHESGLRKILNFGHTVGHALESYFLQTDAPLLHGEAVWFGMLIEAGLARRFAGLSAEDYAFIYQTLNPFCETFSNFPTKLDEISQLILLDKKNEARRLRLSLPSALGQCKYEVEVNLSDVLQAITDYYAKKR